MSQSLVATLNIPFSEEDGIGDKAGQNKIVLEQVAKRFDALGRLPARCYPSRNVRFKVSRGSIVVGEIRSREIYEGIKFSNTSSVRLKYSDISEVTIDSDFTVLMKKSTDSLGRTTIVPALGVQLRYDAETASIVAEGSGYDEDYQRKQVAVYGGCSIRYTAYYQMLYYTPQIESIKFTGGLQFGMGTIFGYNDYDVATLDMELDLSSPPDWVEFGRVTSKIVLDARGVWEFPDNWNTTYTENKEKSNEQKEDYATPGTYDVGASEIDPDQCFVDERVHCIITVNTIGSLKFEDFGNGGDGYWAWYDPYFGDETYNPKYECKWTAPPGGAKASSAEEFKYDLNHRTWRDVFLDVDKAAIKSRFSGEYPGITFEETSR